MDLTTARFSSTAPDGYQVIDVTTGETVTFNERQILSYALAREIREPLNKDQYVIVAVTEAELARDALEKGWTALFVPDFVTFACARIDEKRPVPPRERLVEMGIGEPDDAGNEACIPPHIALRLLGHVGLRLPFETDLPQYRWPLEDSRQRIAATLEDPALPGRLRPALTELAALVARFHDTEANTLLLDYNGLEATVFAPHEHS